MADEVLSQPPLLVMPEACIEETHAFFGSANSTECVVPPKLEDERRQDLLKLMDALKRDYPHMTRATAYYQDLVNADRRRLPYSKLEFVAAGPNANARLGHVELGQRPKPPMPRHLQVVFHHEKQ